MSRFFEGSNAALWNHGMVAFVILVGVAIIVCLCLRSRRRTSCEGPATPANDPLWDSATESRSTEGGSASGSSADQVDGGADAVDDVHEAPTVVIPPAVERAAVRWWEQNVKVLHIFFELAPAKLSLFGKLHGTADTKPVNLDQGHHKLDLQSGIDAHFQGSLRLAFAVPATIHFGEVGILALTGPGEVRVDHNGDFSVETEHEFYAQHCRSISATMLEGVVVRAFRCDRVFAAAGVRLVASECGTVYASGEVFAHACNTVSATGDAVVYAAECKKVLASGDAKVKYRDCKNVYTLDRATMVEDQDLAVLLPSD